MINIKLFTVLFCSNHVASSNKFYGKCFVNIIIQSDSYPGTTVRALHSHIRKLLTRASQTCKLATFCNKKGVNADLNFFVIICGHHIN